MKKMIVRIFSLLLFIAALSSPRLITLVSAQSPPPQHPQHHRHGMSMHVRNWMQTPTGSANPTVTPLDPNTVPKFVNQLTRPATFVPVGTKFDPQLGRNVPLYDVTENTIYQQILPPGFPKTKVYAYGGQVNTAAPGQPAHITTTFSTPGPTFEAMSNKRIFVHYHNELEGPHMFPVDPTIMAANPNNAPIPPPPYSDAAGNPLVPFPPGFPQFQDPIVTVPHLHGGVTPADSDGFPESWFSDETEGGRKTGPTFKSTTFEYFNGQLPTMLWYHDHALGMTRLNLAAGLEGMYIIRDPQNDKIAPLLPSGAFEVPLMLTDRAFNSDGSIHFTSVGDNPDSHPYWDPEYFGDEIMVNGKVWPNMNVQPRQYRFRIVDGSNARFYNLFFSNGMSFTQIGSDGGFLPAPVTETQKLIAICERIDILVDFSNLAPGTKVVLMNNAPAPNPGGDLPDANTGVIMQFTVRSGPAVHPKPLPATLITIPTLTPTPNIGNPKLFTLNEKESPDTAIFPGNPLHVLIDGQHFDAPVTEIPRAGTTEEWYIQNLTQDAHPIHIHLVEFQLEDRQIIDATRALAYFEKLNGPNSALPLDHPTVRFNIENPVIFCNPDPTLNASDCATASRDFQFDTHGDTVFPGDPTQAIPASQFPGENGWKDVVLAPPGMVTRLLIRLAPQSVSDANLKPGQNTFPFDPTAGPGYVWHCHILDHEDNDMMRPMVITFKDLPSLNSAINKDSANPMSYPASRNASAHAHHGSDAKPAVAAQDAVAAPAKPAKPAMEMPMETTPASTKTGAGGGGGGGNSNFK